MHLLITTQSHDIHAEAVATALQARGHRVDIHFGNDFPARQTLSVRSGRSGTRVAATGPEGELALSQADVVWNRRPQQASEPTTLHPADLKFAGREARHIGGGALRLAAPRGFWVNPASAAERARLKPVQVATASECGLAIPETLFGNDPAEIRAFVQEVGPAIYKPCLSANWQDRGRYSTVYTAPITLDDLTDDHVLGACPGIYQARVEKAYEVRVTVLGRTCFALQLDSSAHPMAANDWRRAQLHGLQGRPMTLPTALEEQVLALMDELGLVFGCLDFIVTPAGEWVFLEVNEMGQFLWIEQFAPELPMLDAFVQFLEARDPAFHYTPSSQPLRFAALLADGSVERRMLERAERHAVPARWCVFDESAAA